MTPTPRIPVSSAKFMRRTLSKNDRSEDADPVMTYERYQCAATEACGKEARLLFFLEDVRKTLVRLLRDA
jgi:hypothetical protein